MPIADEQIRTDIENQLFWDSRIDETGVTVTVVNGEVALKGSVSTFMAKQAAEDDAWVIPGVVAVENNITVEYPTTVTLPTDADIKSNVKNVFTWNAVIDTQDLEVSVSDGIVTLRGSVDSYWKMLRAEELVLDVRGVLGVVNEMAVVPTEDFVDETIAEDIVNALKRGPNLNVDDITVEVDDGVVTLTGTVPNAYGRTIARDAALYTPGVVGINNYLMVE
jgi:osmotically-inducible protein OsmY